MRGGSWINNARNVRPAYRNRNEPSNANDNLGFRLSREQGRAGWFVHDPVGDLSCSEPRGFRSRQIPFADGVLVG